MSSTIQTTVKSERDEATRAQLQTSVRPCPTCLSGGRALRPLGEAAHAYNALVVGLESGDEDVESNLLTGDVLVCWECRRVLTRALLFHRQAKRVRANLEACVSSLYKNAMTYSTLTVSSKVGSDYEMKYTEPAAFPFEVKIELDLSPSNAYSATEMTDPIGHNNENFGNDTIIPEKLPNKKCGNKEWTEVTKKVKIDLSESEMLKLRDEQRNKAEYLASPHKCDSCIKGFKHAIILERHKEAKHSKDHGVHPCDICNVFFTTDVQMLNHRIGHYVLYKCSKCPLSCQSRSAIEVHYAEEHETDKSYPCADCDRVFSSGRRLSAHKKNAHEFKMFECERCGLKMRKQNLKRHILTKHATVKRQTHVCDICRKPYSGGEALYAHVRKYHSGRGEPEGGYCVECDTRFATQASYRRHLRASEKHNEHFDFPCEQCERKFLSKADLATHLRRNHTVHSCHLCPKRFQAYGSLRTHVRTVHEGVKPPRKFKCGTCGKAFTTKRLLRNHIVTHTGERPHECETCGARFGVKTTLLTHNRLVHLELERKGASKI